MHHRVRRAAGRGPHNRGSTGSAGRRAPIGRGGRGSSGSSSRNPRWPPANAAPQLSPLTVREQHPETSPGPRGSSSVTAPAQILASVSGYLVSSDVLSGVRLGGKPSRDKNPCMCAAGALRGDPRSRRRARCVAPWRSTSAAESPAAPPPMTTTSYSLMSAGWPTGTARDNDRCASCTGRRSDARVPSRVHRRDGPHVAHDQRTAPLVGPADLRSVRP